MKKRHTLLVGIVALAACGQVGAPPQSASVSPASAQQSASGTSDSAPSGQQQILLDLSEKTFHGLQTQVFTTARRWDLFYVYDCGVNELATLNISISPKGQGIFGGDLVVDVHSGGAAGVVEGLAPGSFSLVIDACGSWHIVAGSNLDTERLLSLTPVASPGLALKQNVTADVEGVGDKQFLLNGPSDSNLLFAYDCGSAGDATLSVLLSDQDPAAYAAKPAVITSSSIIATSKGAPRGWGVLRHLVILSRPGYVPPPGSLSLDVGRAGYPEPQVGCRKWHVIVGTQLELTRPLLPNS